MSEITSEVPEPLKVGSCRGDLVFFSYFISPQRVSLFIPP